MLDDTRTTETTTAGVHLSRKASKV